MFSHCAIVCAGSLTPFTFVVYVDCAQPDLVTRFIVVCKHMYVRSTDLAWRRTMCVLGFSVCAQFLTQTHTTYYMNVCMITSPLPPRDVTPLQTAVPHIVDEVVCSWIFVAPSWTHGATGISMAHPYRVSCEY